MNFKGTRVLSQRSDRTALVWFATGMLLLGCDRPVSPTSRVPGPAAAATITGRVHSAGQPLQDAVVRIKGTPNATRTNSSGEFTLSLPSSLADGSAARVTAAKPGYVIAGTPLATSPLTLELPRIPAVDHEAYAWIAPQPNAAESLNCGKCHLAIYQEWQSTGHAAGTSNRHFRNLYDGSTWTGAVRAGWSLLHDYPDGAGVCAACHTPAADLTELGVGDIRDIGGLAAQGVHCDLCHKVVAVDQQAVGLTHGRFALELRRPATGQLFFGPLDDVDRGEDAWSPVQATSQYCAPCHEGTVFGVPVYTTFSEWQASGAAARGRSCQSCHMQPTGTLTNIAPTAGGIERDPRTLASHQLLPGGRAAMLDRCLQVAAQCNASADSHTVTVTLATHDVGHRVPTGYIDRHLILVVEAWAEDGAVIGLQTGEVLPAAAGDLAALPGALFAKRLVGADGASPLPFWQAGASLVDTRLLPDSKHVQRFAFAPAAVRFRVRLLYRRFWQQTRIDKHWPDDTLTVYDHSLTARPVGASSSSATNLP